MTTELAAASTSKGSSRDGALTIRPFLDVCLAAGSRTLVEAISGAHVVGLVEVLDGRIWRCSHLDCDGDRALRELLEERLDEIVIRRGTGAQNPRNVFEDAFFEAPPMPIAQETPATTKAAEATGAPSAGFETIWDAGVSALLQRNFPQAVEAFRAAALLRPEDPSVRANLARLRDMGFGGSE